MSASDFSVPIPARDLRPSLLKRVTQELRAIRQYRDLIRHLIRTTLAKESTGTVFGALWWLIDPLVLMGVYVFFVDVVLHRGGDNFALFVLTGVIAWKHLSSGLISSISSTLMREQTMRQVAFPRSVLPIAAVLAETIHLLIGIGVYVAVAAAFGVYPTWRFPLVFVVVAIQTMLVLGVAFCCSALNIFFRDLQNLTSYVLRLGFFLSPSLYAPSMIPDDYRQLYDLNPFATLLPAYRSILLYHELPDWSALGLVTAASAVLMALGFLVFVRLSGSFAKLA
jgi:lipopolysaccharide transport system permease protein/teichoic acid transport system permease protein